MKRSEPLSLFILVFDKRRQLYELYQFELFKIEPNHTIETPSLSERKKEERKLLIAEFL